MINYNLDVVAHAHRA